MLSNEFEITKNIRMTEEIQCQLLEAVSTLFRVLHDNGSRVQKAEALARAELLLGLLSKRMNVSRDFLDQKEVAQIKLMLLDEEKAAWRMDLLQTLREMESPR